jgi:hypothetical protein
MANDNHLTHNDLTEVLRQLRQHVATRDDLRELADAIDAEKVRCPPHSWRFTILRDSAGLISEVIASPIPMQ